ncbi:MULTISPECIES: hypothetical protein [unclassified Bacillus (in: firmicutes)]|uniref:hypothetical protein n=1 Tax=unclassified Bacillus (in: firmicutes) TaxID=185979 RepID=UPI00157689BC|nr:MULTISPECIES: hypothetical protein [unclassified Bacillus (in: firmicutes)]CAH0344189.1 hypothetical protein BCI9360_00431 [Bacillus sp. CECT 9360]
MAKEIKKDHVPENSSMAKDFEEMKELGKQMENLRTNEELKDWDKRPGTVQHEEVEQD